MHEAGVDFSSKDRFLQFVLVGDLCAALGVGVVEDAGEALVAGHSTGSLLSSGWFSTAVYIAL